LKVKTMETGVEIIAVVCLLVVGLSHILQPRAWVEFFIALRQRGAAGVLVVALLNLPLGLLIVAFHQRFSGLALVTTLLGWCSMIKATIYFLFPRVGLSSLRYVTPRRAWMFVVAGWVSVAVSGLIGYSMLARS
jgi:uncharacterized membrane protein